MTNRKLITIYLTVTLIFLFGIVMRFYDYNYYGYWTTKIINWIWLTLTVIFIIWFWRKKLTKIYFFALLTLIFLSILPMAIPFLGILYSFSTIDDYQQIKLNDTYRIERTRQQALSIPRIYVYKREGIFEVNICRPSYAEILENVLNVDSYKNSIDERKLPIQDAKLIYVNNDSIGIEYKISNKKKMVFHKVENEDGY